MQITKFANSKESAIQEFNEIFYEGEKGTPIFDTLSWMGVKVLKCPFDLWVYQEILFNTRPDIIIETGLFCGGSTLFLAHLCDLLGAGRILGVDLTLSRVHQKVFDHPRITLFEGSSIDPRIVSLLENEVHGKRTMVILDSDHSEKHVLGELRAYAGLVSPGCYLICEDTNVNGHPVFPDHGPGPYEAVQTFLRGNTGWKVDTDCERLLVTFNPNGYLLRQA